ncbi:hypothetical protein ZHAS_00008218 [Anopheles sinensis]|uniref:Poly [ADP-ribose] polymerase n=1 Tax=Anopheles sinensis TaxID=74873 RepID=A0A084VS43_ANOSI|nr:hypothetical protein ZHAS_00008218 [Anopheles sinensis]
MSANRSRSMLSVNLEAAAMANDPLRDLFEACKTGDLVKVKKLITPQTVNARDTAGRKSTPLHFAAGYGRRDVVEFLLANGASIQARDDGGLHPLHNACSFGHADVVRLLLEAGANPNTRDNWNYTPLHEAASKGKIDVCIALLQHGADPNIRNSENKIPLDLADPCTRPVLTGEYRKDELLEAARSGSEERLLELLTPLNVNCHASDGRKSTPLHLAAGYNRIRVVQILLQHGADVHAKDKGGLVPLHNACSYGHFEVTELLIKHGGNVNANDLWAFTPLHEAASKSRVEVCSLLLSEGADPTLLNCHNKSAIDSAPTRELQEKIAYEYKGHCVLDACRQADIQRLKKNLTTETVNFIHPYTGDTPVHAVAQSVYPKRKQVLEVLIRKGALLNEKNKDFLTPLHISADNSHNELMDVLLRHGAKVDALDGLGQTALHRCAREDNIQACRLLLSYGIDTGIVSLQGYTAAQLATENVLKILQDPPSDTVDLECQLLEAAKAGDIDSVRRIVLSSPMTVNCRDLDGRHSTPLHFAAGYNRVPVVEFLLEHGAEVHASDKGGLVPLHNACSYGHYEVTELLVKHGANVNVADLWKFTPLHEAAAKGKYEIVKLLIKHGADVTKKNRDGATPLDLVREGDQDVADLLRGNAALLDAAKKGNLARVQRLVTSDNINCRDAQGRNSTPLHLAAGYNNLEVAEYLLEHGADVNAQDKGGLIPLHNASSYGHLDIAALLIKHNTVVNATDKWGYTPLHEAAQKGRTQLCSLLLAHGADPFMKNQEGQTSLDLATAEDVKCLLQDAMVASQGTAGAGSGGTLTGAPGTAILSSNGALLATTCSPTTETVTLPTGASMTLSVPVPQLPIRSCLSPAQGAEANVDGIVVDHDDKMSSVPSIESSVSVFLTSLQLEHLIDLFEREQITMDILAEMGHEDLKQIQKVQNRKLWERYVHRRQEISEENGHQASERMLFHGSPFINAIVQKGFDERHAYIGGMFGAGIYFAEHSSKSNQYVYGIGGGIGCPTHKDKSCYQCHRQLLLCRVALGKSFLQFSAMKMAHAPPGHHSVIGRPSAGGLHFPEYVVYRGEQVLIETRAAIRIENAEEPLAEIPEQDMESTMEQKQPSGAVPEEQAKEETTEFLLYPLIPGVSPCYRTEFGAFILPDLSTDAGVDGRAIGLVIPPGADEVVLEILVAFLHAGGGGVQVPKNVRTGIEIARSVTGTAAGVTSYVAGKVGSATMALGRFLAPHIQRHGSALLSYGTGMSAEDASERMNGALTICAGAVEGFGTVYEGLERSASILGQSLSSSTVKIVEHRYGEEASRVVGSSLDTVGNVINVTHNVNCITPKGFAKRTAKNAGKALVAGYRPPVPEVDAVAGSSGTTPGEPTATIGTVGTVGSIGSTSRIVPASVLYPDLGGLAKQLQQ